MATASFDLDPQMTGGIATAYLTEATDYQACDFYMGWQRADKELWTTIIDNVDLRWQHMDLVSKRLW